MAEENYQVALAKYRLESAKERLTAAKTLLATGSYKDSVSRSYYAMFTAARALLALDGVDFSKHGGVISYFQKEYVKTGRMDTKYSKYLSRAFKIRNDSDYEDFYLVSKDEAEEQLEKAEDFCSEVEKIIEKRAE